MRFSQLTSPVVALLIGTAVATYETGGACSALPVVSSTSSAAQSSQQSTTRPSKPSSTNKSTPTILDVDLVVIGGGSAGIHAAIQMKDAGAKVIVIEKKKQIGGHAQTYFAPNGAPLNAGVVIFENSTVVSDYFSRLKVKSILFDPAKDFAPGAPANTLYDFSLGFPIPAQNESASQARSLAIAAAAESYTVNVLMKYPWIDAGFLVPDPVPAELSLPFGELAKKYNFEPLLSIIAQLNFYTGDISTIPALYGIKNLGPGLLRSTFGKFIVPSSGNTRTLYDAAAKELGDSVLLESTIVSVRRTAKTGKIPTGVKVLVSQPGQAPKLIRAKKLLVAIPQTLKNIGTFDVSGDERDIFSKFTTLGYWGGIVTIPGLSNGLTNIGIHTPYNQPVIPGPLNIQLTSAPGYFITSVGFSDMNYTEESGKAVIRKSLTTLAAAATFPFSSDNGPYNLRVSADDIKTGFYKKFLGLQGKRNTYWAGAAFAGHNSALVWNFNVGTVVPGLKRDLGL
ncbi:flavin-containing superfamily amine oxidase [Rhexocercosporidium sp. MPI-PUGE-AT-0058]|nr:flavin-containing superfamily amine oxidase [Rhexocercosporidium sp. MPI-PUGE-AT-0058]